MKIKDILKNADWLDKNKALRANLSEELRKKYGLRSIRVRVGDTVKVMRGDYKGVQGKVTDVFPDLGRIAVEGLMRKKVNGQEVPVKVHPSKVMVVELNLEDKKRKEEIEGKAENQVNQVG
ncbi:MAG: 50S ribosomal protein L24 [Nitrososphaeria archaeon]